MLPGLRFVHGAGAEELVHGVPLTERRRSRLSKLRFHDLEERESGTAD